MTSPVSATSAASALALSGSTTARDAASTVSGGVYNDFGELSKLKSQSHTDPKEAMKEVAHQFESLFVTMMMKAMRDTLPKDGILSSTEMDSYQSMFDQQLSLDLSRKGSLGLASIIQRQLSHTITPRGE